MTTVMDVEFYCTECKQRRNYKTYRIGEELIGCECHGCGSPHLILNDHPKWKLLAGMFPMRKETGNA